jgi:hypothetical protein
VEEQTVSVPANLFPDDSRLPVPYAEPHQARKHTPTVYENELADALEAAFAAEAWDLDALVARLNQYGLRTPDGQEWSMDGFQAVMARLGA